MKILNTLLTGVNAALDVVLRTIMAVSTASVLVVSFIQILSRFVMQMSVGWSTDVLRLSFIYAIFSGIAYCGKMNEHINLDIFLAVLKPRTRRVVETAVVAVVAVFCAVLAWYGYRYTLFGMRQAAPFLRIPMATYYAAVPISMALMAYYYLQLLVRNVAGLLSERGGNAA